MNRRLCFVLTVMTSAAGLPLATQATQGPVAWTARAPATDGPRPLGSGRLVYDDAQKRVFLVDAAAPSGSPAQTGPLRAWSWNGASWMPQGDAGPGWRVASGAAFDTVRQRLVMFGGGTIPSTSSLDETWEFDGQSWTQHRTGNPPGRDHHAMAYDVVGRRTLVFGGGTFVKGQPYELRDETWAWDGSKWQQVATAGPGARRLPAMAFDGVRRQIVMFGGVGRRPSPDVDPPVFADTWIWSGGTWQRVADGGPPARYGHAMTFDARAGVVLIYGGYTVGDQPLADMWQWDGRRWTEVASNGQTPGPRFGASMAHDVVRGFTLLYGGRREDPSVWEWQRR